jgi:methylmalonyl-CoA mutase C-terminal domain/subunit
VDLLREHGAGDVIVTVGGTIPADDIAELKDGGVAAVFTPGTTTAEIISTFRTAIARTTRRGES